MTTFTLYQPMVFSHRANMNCAVGTRLLKELLKSQLTNWEKNLIFNSGRSRFANIYFELSRNIPKKRFFWYNYSICV